jgi:hypothetical protein
MRIVCERKAHRYRHCKCTHCTPEYGNFKTKFLYIKNHTFLDFKYFRKGNLTYLVAFLLQKFAYLTGGGQGDAEVDKTFHGPRTNEGHLTVIQGISTSFDPSDRLHSIF